MYIKVVDDKLLPLDACVYLVTGNGEILIDTRCENGIVHFSDVWYNGEVNIRVRFYTLTYGFKPIDFYFNCDNDLQFCIRMELD